MAGQREDRRLQPEGGTRSPSPTTIVRALTVSPSPPVRRVQEVRPVDVRRIDAGRQVVDLGQNINGWVRLTDLGPADTELTLVHGEALDASRRRHAGPSRRWRPHRRAARCRSARSITWCRRVARAIGSNRGTRRTASSTSESKDTHTGSPPTTSPASSCTPTSAARVGSGAATSASTASTRSPTGASATTRARSRPTVPQRERSGWTGDWQVFLPSAAFLYDVAGFSLDWLRDLAVEQRADGRVRNYAPDPLLPRHPGGTHDFLQGSAGWGDAIVMVPWVMSRIYRDDGVLAELWPAMVRWVEYAAQAAALEPFPRAGGGSARSRTARGLPVGHRVPLGRVARAGRWRVGSRSGPRGDRVPRPFRVARGADRPVARARRRRRALRRPRDARARMRGEPNTSTSTDP